jgi:hypothetical protein
MTRVLRRFDLDARGADYVRKRVNDLTEYGEALKALCNPLDALIGTAPGQTWTLAPPNTPADQLYQFEWGGLLAENLDMSRAIDVGGSTMMAIESLQEEERALLLALMREETGRACILADPIPNRDDPCVDEYYTRAAAFLGDKMFHIVDAASEDDAVELAFAASPFWTDLHIVTTAPPKIDTERNVTAEALSRSASAAIAISCSAYDGEGFVIWRRT